MSILSADAAFAIFILHVYVSFGIFLIDTLLIGLLLFVPLGVSLEHTIFISPRIIVYAECFIGSASLFSYLSPH